MMGRKQALSNWIETEVVYIRHQMCYLVNRPSIVKWAKRRMNKRMRRDARRDAMKRYDDLSHAEGREEEGKEYSARKKGNILAGVCPLCGDPIAQGEGRMVCQNCAPQKWDSRDFTDPCYTAADIAAAEERGRREGIEKAKAIFRNEHDSTGATAWNLVCVIKTLDALLPAKGEEWPS